LYSFKQAILQKTTLDFKIIKTDLDSKRYFEILYYGKLKLLVFALLNDAVTMIGKLKMALSLLLKIDKNR
jgi:hypothetical protein